MADSDEELKEAVRILARAHNKVLTPEMITALAAIFIGLCALAVSVFEVRVLHSQERATFWPHLQIAVANARDDENVALVVVNQGTGPAIKKAASVSRGGAFFKTWREFMASVDNAPPSFTMNGLLSMSALPPGDGQSVFIVPNTEEYAAVHQAIAELDVTLCYCSLLDECWTVRMPGPDFDGRLQDLMAKEGACDIPEEQQFLE